MVFNKSKLVASIGTIPVILLGNCLAQLSSPVGNIPVKNVAMNERTLNILAALAEKYKVVIGVYGTLLGSDSSKINVAVTEGTLADVLNSVTAQDPRFEWKQADDGGIHITTRESPLPVFEIRVASFDAEGLGRAEAVPQLTRIPEVASWLNTHRCLMDEIVAGRPPSDWAHFPVHVKDEPLSFLLDQIAAKSRTYFWSAIRYSVEPCTINLKP